MDKKSKIFFAVFFTLIAAVVIITYMKYFVAKDYYITAQADCDPTAQKCFIWKCDPNSTDPTEKCTGDPTKDTWYYQDVKKLASQIPLCDPDSDDSCKALECDSGMDCMVTYCNDITKKAEGVDCSDPDEYNKENPPAATDNSDNSTCAPDDQSCVNADQSGDNSGSSADQNASGQSTDSGTSTGSTAPDNSSGN